MLGDDIRATELRVRGPLRGAHKWSGVVRTYEDASGEPPGDSVKMAALFNVRHREARTHLQLNARGLQCAQDVKEVVLVYVNAQQAGVDAGNPIDVAGVQRQRESAEEGWGAVDVGAAQ